MKEKIMAVIAVALCLVLIFIYESDTEAREKKSNGINVTTCEIKNDAEEADAVLKLTETKDEETSKWFIKNRDLNHYTEKCGDVPTVEEVYHFTSEFVLIDYDELENLFLIRHGGVFYKLDLSNNRLEKLIEGSLDYFYLDGIIYYTDTEYVEYTVDWKNNSESERTGRKVISYATDELLNSKAVPEIDEENNAAFLKLQRTYKEDQWNPKYLKYRGLNAHGFSSIVYDDFGNVVSDLHLPYAVKPNPNFWCTGHINLISVANNNDKSLTFYSKGEVVKNIPMPENNGKWRMIDVCYYDEFNDTTKVLLYNYIDRTIWSVTCDVWSKYTAEKKHLIAGDVWDFAYYEDGEKYIIYWMDNKNDVYSVSPWYYDWETPELVCKNVIKLHDSGLGYIVRPDDSRAEKAIAKINGLDVIFWETK